MATASKVGRGPASATAGRWREPAGSDAAARLEEALHDPVLEAVEGDHGEPAAGREHLLGGGEPALELGQLLVDVDAQRLEGPRRRILLHVRLVSPSALRTISASWPVRSIGRAATIARAIRRDLGSSP